MIGGPWKYSAQLVRVVDGDTLDLRVTRDIDFGFRMQHQLSAVMRFRMLGIDTPEKTGRTKAMGDAARGYVEHLLSTAVDLEVESLGEADKYGGRWDARLRLSARLAPPGAGAPPLPEFVRLDLADHLITFGFAQPYSGAGARPQWSPDVPYPLPEAQRWRRIPGGGGDTWAPPA